jgi:hypothetical protein
MNRGMTLVPKSNSIVYICFSNSIKRGWLIQHSSVPDTVKKMCAAVPSDTHEVMEYTPPL